VPRPAHLHGRRKFGEQHFITDNFCEAVHRTQQHPLKRHSTVAIMSESQVTLRTRKFIRNPLLGRKQMVVCVIFPSTFRRLQIWHDRKLEQY
jgi:hypothetical protein